MHLNEIRASLVAGIDALPLTYDGEAGARRLLGCLSERESSDGAQLRARRWAVPILLAVAIGGGGVASAIGLSSSDGVKRFFSDVPRMAQEKEAGGRTLHSSAARLPDAPHALVAKLSVPDGGYAEVYVTTGAVDSQGSRCILLAHVLPDGSDGGSEGACGAGPDAASASLSPYYTAFIGTVPKRAITSVEVNLNGRILSAKVVAQYFIVTPPGGVSPAATAGSGSITGFYVDGRTAGSWPFSLTPTSSP